ncbi:MAG: hypothetical protein KC561_16825, partial [Myxococcales bacterium]|nr:hypothetical protein [Myxococcales bacterium]
SEVSSGLAQIGVTAATRNVSNNVVTTPMNVPDRLADVGVLRSGIIHVPLAFRDGSVEYHLRTPGVSPDYGMEVKVATEEELRFDSYSLTLGAGLASVEFGDDMPEADLASALRYLSDQLGQLADYVDEHGPEALLGADDPEG